MVRSDLDEMHVPCGLQDYGWIINYVLKREFRLWLDQKLCLEKESLGE